MTTLRTVSGDYHVGMKRAQAKDKKEFDRIDSNRNGILGGGEICNERDREALAEKQRWGAVDSCGSYLIATGGTGLCCAAATGPVSPGVALVSIGSVGIGSLVKIGAGYFDDSEEIMKETQKYRKKHQNSSIFNQ